MASSSCIRSDPSSWLSELLSPAFAEMFEIFCSSTPACAHPLQDIADLAGADIADFFSAIAHTGPARRAARQLGALPLFSGALRVDGDAQEGAGGDHEANDPLSSTRGADSVREVQLMAPAVLAGHDSPFFPAPRGEYSNPAAAPPAEQPAGVAASKATTFQRAQHAGSLRSSFVEAIVVPSPTLPPPPVGLRTEARLTQPHPDVGSDPALHFHLMKIPSIQVCVRETPATSAALDSTACSPVQPPSESDADVAERSSQRDAASDAASPILSRFGPRLSQSGGDALHGAAGATMSHRKATRVADASFDNLEGWAGWRGTANTVESSVDWTTRPPAMAPAISAAAQAPPSAELQVLTASALPPVVIEAQQMSGTASEVTCVVAQIGSASSERDLPMAAAAPPSKDAAACDESVPAANSDSSPSAAAEADRKVEEGEPLTLGSGGLEVCAEAVQVAAERLAPGQPLAVAISQAAPRDGVKSVASARPPLPPTAQPAAAGAVRRSFDGFPRAQNWVLTFPPQAVAPRGERDISIGAAAEHPGVAVGLGETLSQQDLVAALWGAHSRGEMDDAQLEGSKISSASRNSSFASEGSWIVVESNLS